MANRFAKSIIEIDFANTYKFSALAEVGRDLLLAILEIDSALKYTGKSRQHDKPTIKMDDLDEHYTKEAIFTGVAYHTSLEIIRSTI